MDPSATWIRARGGVAPVPHRVAAALDRLQSPANVSVRVLRSSDLAAYAWPDGSIFVTQGLIDRLDDAELTAAIAHELGHLIADGHLQAATSLLGIGREKGREHEADVIGVQLLAEHGLSPADMERMLRNVASAIEIPHYYRAELRRRANLLLPYRKHQHDIP